VTLTAGWEVWRT